MSTPAHAVAAAVLLSAVVLGQQVIPAGEDPHYKRLLFTAHLRLFEIAIPAGAATLDHSHDHDIVTVALGESTVRTRQAGPEWSAPQPYMPGATNVTNYTGAAAAHRVENVGKTPFRAFTVENLRDRGWSMPQLITAPATTLVQESRSFAVYEVRLTGSTSRTNHVHQMPTVVMLVSGGVEVQGGGGESEFRMETAGRWFPSQWDQPHTLTLSGSGDAHLIEVEAR